MRTKIKYELTDQNIDLVNQKLNSLPACQTTDQLLKNVLNNWPNNTDFHAVITKILLIDFVFSTNLFRHVYSKRKARVDLIGFAKHIASIKNFDKRVQSGDNTLINDILLGTGVNIFSFATKYCMAHNVYVYGKDDYRIYDKSIREYLISVGIKRSALNNAFSQKDYASFESMIDEHLKNNNITRGKRAFDQYVWGQWTGRV